MAVNLPQNDDCVRTYKEKRSQELVRSDAVGTACEIVDQELSQHIGGSCYAVHESRSGLTK